MTTMAKGGLSESLLNSIINDLKSDMPIINSFQRSWEQLEKRKPTKKRVPPSEVKQVLARAKMTEPTRSASSCSGEDLTSATDSWSSTSIPGFRYRANGDEKKACEDGSKKDLLKPTLQRKHNLDADGGPPHDKGLRTADPGDAAGEDKTDVHTQHASTRKPVGFLDEVASYRVRKVQEQLGLQTPLVTPYVLNTLDTAQDVEDLEKALRVLNRKLRKTESEKTRPKSTKSKKKKKGTPEDDEATHNHSHHLTHAQSRCDACYNCMAWSEPAPLMRTSDPNTYRKPRWRLQPSGRYVSPPLKTLRISYPTLFAASDLNNSLNDRRTSKESVPPTGARSKVPQGDSYFRSLISRPRPKPPSQGPFFSPSVSDNQDTETRTTGNGMDQDCDDPMKQFDSMLAMVAVESKMSGDSGGSSSVDKSTDDQEQTPSNPNTRLTALKNRNRRESEILEKKVRDFLESMPSKATVSV